MTFTNIVSEPDTGPRWVISFPGVVPEDVIYRIREQMTDPEDVRPIVLAEGGTMYDARVGPPLSIVEATPTAEHGPWWMLYLAVLLNAVAVVGLCLTLAFWK